ncbi:MAG: T9SS type A sorting domain-containing protein, partial [Paludibacter sp.]
SLVGITNPKIGVQNLTWFNVFDFQVGDEIHISDKYYPYPPEPQYFSENKIIKRYLSRRNFTDSIIYTIDRTQSNPYKHDTIESKICVNREFDKLSYETAFDPTESNKYDCAFKYTMKNTAPLCKIEPPVPAKFYNTESGCWNWLPVDGCLPEYTYIKGLGGPYFNDCEAVNLVYYKKGNETWGVPYLNLGFNQINIKPNIFVLPNPSTDKINIDNLTESCTFELLDLKGSVMLRTTINASEKTINVSQYDKGLYLYRISGKEGLMKTGKIVKN